MKLSPRKTVTGAAAVLLLTAVAACSSSGSSPSSASSAGSSTFGVNATGTVTFWARQATDGVSKAMVAQFNATHKNLKVVLHLTQPNEATTELGTAIRAGDVPDLVGLNDINVPLFMHEGALMSLTPYVNALSYKSSLSPGHLKLATQNSQYYGVPFLADLSVLWYNKTLFKEAGLNPASPPASYPQIIADAKKISALGHGISGFSFAGDDFIIPKGAKNASGAWEFVTWVLQRKQQDEYPSLGDTPVRTDLLTSSFRAANPYDAVALTALAHGSVEYTLGYNAVFNAPGSPWFKMFEDAVYNGNLSTGISEGQSGIQSALSSVNG